MTSLNSMCLLFLKFA